MKPSRSSERSLHEASTELRAEQNEASINGADRNKTAATEQRVCSETAARPQRPPRQQRNRNETAARPQRLQRDSSGTAATTTKPQQDRSETAARLQRDSSQWVINSQGVNRQSMCQSAVKERVGSQGVNR